MCSTFCCLFQQKVERVESPPLQSLTKRLAPARANFGRAGPAPLPAPNRWAEPIGRRRPLPEKPNGKRVGSA